ncbi:MAG: hypothetical protein MEEGG_01336 [Eggerthella lenta]
MGAACGRGAGVARGRPEIRAARASPERSLGARAYEAEEGRARRELAAHQGEGRLRARGCRHRWVRNVRANRAHHGRDRARGRRGVRREPLRPRGRRAGQAGELDAARRQLAVRGEVRRLPHRRIRRRRPGAPRHAQRQRLHPPLSRHRALPGRLGGGTSDGARRRARGNRRGRKDRFPGAAELPARPFGQAPRLRGVRPAGVRGRRSARPAARRAQGAAGVADERRARQPALQRARARQRCGQLPRRLQAASRRRGGQAGRFAVPRRSQRRLDQAEMRKRAGIRRRRIHAVRQARARDQLALAGAVRGRPARVRRTRGLGIERSDLARAAGRVRRPRATGRAFRRRAEAAPGRARRMAGPPNDRAGEIRRMDRGRPAATPQLPGHPHRQRPARRATGTRIGT